MRIGNPGTETHRQVLGTTLLPKGHGPVNFQTLNNNSSLVNGQSHNSLSGSAMSYHNSSHLCDKFQFSKTQKIDLKEANKNIMMIMKDGITHRELSNENKKNSLSPFKDEKQHYANLLK